jgi:microcystin-dependent protein
MADPFVAEIRIYPFSFAPTGWAFCDGQLMPLSQNTALFSLLGTYYGGDGKSTFALPDLQGAAPLHAGQGPGLEEYFLGEMGGTESVTLLESEMPAHDHLLQADVVDVADTNVPSPNATFALSSGGTMYQSLTPDTTLAAQAATPAGGSLPHNNLQPYLTLNFCIALQGVYPPRS